MGDESWINKSSDSSSFYSICFWYSSSSLRLTSSSRCSKFSSYESPSNDSTSYTSSMASSSFFLFGFFVFPSLSSTNSYLYLGSFLHYILLVFCSAYFSYLSFSSILANISWSYFTSSWCLSHLPSFSPLSFFISFCPTSDWPNSIWP